VTAQVKLGGCSCDGSRIPGLNEKKPVLHGRISISVHCLEVGKFTNRVGLIEGLIAKRFLAVVIGSRVSRVVGRANDTAEDEPNGNRSQWIPHRSQTPQRRE
jgi:hypothetical protein